MKSADELDYDDYDEYVDFLTGWILDYLDELGINTVLREPLYRHIKEFNRRLP